jgi:hypothetical protein
MSDPERLDVLELRLQALAERIERDGRDVTELRAEVARLRDEPVRSALQPSVDAPVEDDHAAIGYREAPPTAAPSPAPASPRGRRIGAAALVAGAVVVAAVARERRHAQGPADGSAVPPPDASRPSKPYVCEEGSDTITGRSIVASSGPAVSVKNGCDLRFVRCRIEGDVGIDFQGGIAKVWLEDTTVTGRRAAVAMNNGGIHELHGIRSRVRGALDVESGIFTGEGLTAFTPTEIPGFPTVAPLALLAQARDADLLLESAKLVGFQARFVGTGALVDFASKLYRSEVEYTFEVDLDAPPPPPAPDLPPGVPPPPLPAIDRREIHTVKLTAEGMLAGAVKRERTLPRDTAPIEPRCSLADVWKQALAAGVHEASVAQIRYQVEATGKGTWDFEIGGTRTRYRIEDASCARRP